MGNKIEKLTSNLLDHSVKLKKGEKVLIEMIGTDCSDLACELIKQAKQIGAIPVFNIIDYKVLKENSNYSKLLINIETGRKNQIRVQLANIHHPILGDKKYGDDKEKRLFLHASKLEAFNPITRKTMTFTSKVPSIFNSKIK